MVKVIKLLSKVRLKSDHKILNPNPNTPNYPPTLGKRTKKKKNPGPFPYALAVAPSLLIPLIFIFQTLHSLHLLLPHSLKFSLYLLYISTLFPNTIVRAKESYRF